MTALGEALRAATETLAAAGVDTPRADARLLAAEVLGRDATWVFAHPEYDLAAAEADRLQSLTGRRAGREPMAQILGRREFWSLSFKVTGDTLVPRPDSETLVETALAGIADRQAALRLLDLGTGTGCLLLALLSELPNARGLGIDASPAAVDVAHDNAAALGLAARAEIRQGDWGRDLAGPFDLVVANPPYIPDADLDSLMPEVARFDPRAALAGGADGLDSYRRITADLAHLLAPGGRVLFEVGAGQAGAVAALLRQAGMQDIEIADDLGGVARCVAATRKTA